MKILITGVSGVGKSTLCNHFNLLGYNAFDMDDIPNLCKLFHSDGTPVAPKESCIELDMLRTDFLCDTKILGEHIHDQTGLVFYFGYVDNFKEVASYFDKIILLTISPEENRRRMSIRTMTDFAKDEKTQNELLAYKDEWEGIVQKYDTIVVNASGSTAEIAQNILGELD